MVNTDTFLSFSYTYKIGTPLITKQELVRRYVTKHPFLFSVNQGGVNFFSLHHSIRVICSDNSIVSLHIKFNIAILKI